MFLAVCIGAVCGVALGGLFLGALLLLDYRPFSESAAVFGAALAGFGIAGALHGIQAWLETPMDGSSKSDA